MDIQMPVMDGKTAIILIREHEKTTHTLRGRTPIIVFSASATSEEIKSVQEVGCDDYVSKPLNRAELLGKIQQHIQR